MLTTGMLMFGKDVLGRAQDDERPENEQEQQRQTTKVYGRRSARRTIHMKASWTLLSSTSLYG